MACNQSPDACEEGDAQQGVGHHDDADVDGEQRRGEHGHEMTDLRIHL